MDYKIKISDTPIAAAVSEALASIMAQAIANERHTDVYVENWDYLKKFSPSPVLVMGIH